MNKLDPDSAREFAVQVVRKLRAAGYQALWAGGCVRDQVLGRVPKDYDVATNATPEEIRTVFGHRRTLAIGAAFGVITVLGPRDSGQIEVATFRQDAAYSDGRHPDSVTFSSAEEDAKRRDFTINGLFFDPLAEELIDYVGGEDDLRRKVIRAIGNPHQRLDEDKLRMLRAVRFASTFDFELDNDTLHAVRQHAGEITIVSAERIAAEMRQILSHASRAAGVALLRRVGLLPVILPESACLSDGDDSAWTATLEILDKVTSSQFPVALAVLLREIQMRRAGENVVQQVCRRWKLSGNEHSRVDWLLKHEQDVRQAREIAWPRLQRVLIAEGVDDLLAYAEAVARVIDGHIDDVDYCRERLAVPPEQLNPAPLITGDDLIEQGIPPSPAYAEILRQVRDAQLEHRLDDKPAAMKLATSLWQAARE